MAVFLGVLTPAIAIDSAIYRDRFCAGMLTEKPVPFGGRVDCLSEEYAIEVEWADDWYQAVGQALYYAYATKRKPGIIILCPDASTHGEGLCRSYLYRLAAAISFVKVPIAVWYCFLEDQSLDVCVQPDMSPP